MVVKRVQGRCGGRFEDPSEQWKLGGGRGAVLVSSGYNNKIPQTEDCHNSSGGWEVPVSADLVSGEGLLLSFLTWWGERSKLSTLSSATSSNPHMRAPLWRPSHLPRAPPPTLSLWELEFQHVELRGYKYMFYRSSQGKLPGVGDP